jgi:hypothetical protein
MTQLLQLISTKEITMLKDIDLMIKINKIGKFRHYYIPNMEVVGISNFISKLDDDTFYTIVPIISMFGKIDDPYIVLSKQILVSRDSSPKVIHEYLNSKLDKAILEFASISLEGGNYFQLTFKYKKLTLDFSRLPDHI